MIACATPMRWIIPFENLRNWSLPASARPTLSSRERTFFPSAG